MCWNVKETSRAVKQVARLPHRVREHYRYLIADLAQEGPFAKGWRIKRLKNSPTYSVRLNRNYRVLFELVQPDIVVIKVAHRKEIYR